MKTISDSGLHRKGVGAVIAAIALVALVVTGCSSSGSSSSTSSAAATTSAAAASTSPAGPAPGSLKSLLPPAIQQSGQIMVANPLSNPPYAFLETDGTTLDGIAPDLAKALEPLFGVTFKWVNTPFPSLIPGLQAAKFDMIWGSITDTKAREATLDFIDYEKDGTLLLVKGGNPDKVTDIASLCGKVAAALSGSVDIPPLQAQSTKCTAAGQGAITIKIYQSVADAELAVRSGTATTFFAGLGAALYQVKTTAADNQFATTGPTYDAALLGVAFLKTNTALSTAIQTGLKALVANGTYGKIFDKYGLSQATLAASEITLNGGIT